MKKLYLLFTLCLTLLGFTKANAETTLVSCDAGLGEILFTDEVVEIPVTTEYLNFTFSDEIKSVEALIIQSATSNGEIIISEDDYYFYGNTLGLTLPLEQTLKCQDLTFIMQVFDKNDEPVTFTNHSNPGYSAPGMIFVEYALTPVEPTIVEINPEPGEMEAINKSIYMTFNTSIAEVEMIEVKDSKGWTAEMVLDENYYFWDKDISIVLPKETAQKEDLSVTLKVKDIQGKYATYGEEEGMVNLAYTLVPVTPTVEDCGAVNQTITTATTSIEIMFSTPLDSVGSVAVQAPATMYSAELVEGEGFTVYDNILTINLPAAVIESLSYIPEGYPEEYYSITVGIMATDVQGKTITYTNSPFYDQETAEGSGMTFLHYQVVPVTKVTSISPACGEYETMPTEITITFDGDIQELEYGAIRTNTMGFMRGYMMTEDDYSIEGNKMTIKVPAEYTTPENFYLSINMNVKDAKGQYVTYSYDPEDVYEGAVNLFYTTPIKADLYTMVASDPAEGEVEKLDVINVTFNDAYEYVGGFDETKEVVVLDVDGNVVTKATMEVVEDEWYTSTVKFTLETPVTTVGAYVFVIPEATVYNVGYYPYDEDFGVSNGAVYNPEVRIEYTVISGDVTGINNVTVAGKAGAYTLDGRKVNNLTKGGIYVINGKKVYVK